MNPYLSTWLDALATAVWLTLGVAVEGNPALGGLVELVGPWPAMLVRGIVGTGLLLSLQKLTGRSKLAAVGWEVVRWVLTLVVAWHVVGITLHLMWS